MGLTRRAFLQQIGLAMAALGLDEAGLSLLTDRYQQALAEPTRRKLALLIGINQYPEQVCDYLPVKGSTALNGCLTDVELQRELLIDRFGFQPADILTLTDQQATRQAIADAFLSHLTEQAGPGDVVVFHFSGLGSRIRLGDAEAEFHNSLVPIDGTLPSEENPVINDLMEETLGLLLRSLRTEQVTTVLDTSYTDLGRVLQGNLRIRSRPNAPSGRLHPAELALQDQLMNQTAVSIEQVQTQWRSGQLPGVVLAATSANQIAAEGQWNGFSAGLFTHALTQQLWWTTPATTLRISLGQAIGTVKQLAGAEQQPYLSGQKIQDQVLRAYYLNPDVQAGADGAIKAVEDDGKLQLWLAGLPAALLENYGASLFAIASTPPTQPPTSGDQITVPTVSSVINPLLQIRSREGLLCKARPYYSDAATSMSPQVGQLVHEVVRILPRNVGLTIALDTSLERIERVDATSAFAAIPRVSSVIAGEQSADFLFGKMQPMPQTLTASLPPQLLAKEGIKEWVAEDNTPETLAPPDTHTPAFPPTLGKNGYGLFYLGRDAIPNSLIEQDEAVKTAIHRMTPQLQILLANKLLRLTENRGSSRLGVRATLEMVAPQERIVMQQETVRADWKPPSSKLAALFAGNRALMLPIGSQIQYRLHNYSDRPLYFVLLGLDTSGSAIALYPALRDDRNPQAALLDESLLPPGETRIVPRAAAADWIIQAPTGLSETHLIFSREPLTQSYQALAAAMRSKTDGRRVALVVNPQEVVQAILQDLHQVSATTLPKVDIPTDSYALDVNAWATLSFVYQVVAG